MSANNMLTARTRALWAVLAVLVAGLAIAMWAMPAVAHADKGEAYTYKIRVLDGNFDTIDGGIWEKTVNAGESVSLTDSGVKVGDVVDKYQVKGFRVSGKDNDDAGALIVKDVTTVTEDMDFVVSYGMEGDMVSYTLKFVEYGTGKALTADNGATSATYYGSKGDKPVVSYEYISGYRPRYRNITGTLGDEGSNNWTLEYIKLAEGENENGTTNAGATNAGNRTTTKTTNAGTTGGTTGGTAAGGTAGTTAGGNAASGAAASAGAASAGAASAGAASAGAADASVGAASAAATPATPPATEEVLDVDNPLASGVDDADTGADSASDGAATSDSEAPSSASGIPVAAIYGIAAFLVAAIAAALYILKRRRDSQYDDLFNNRE